MKNRIIRLKWGIDPRPPNSLCVLIEEGYDGQYGGYVLFWPVVVLEMETGRRVTGSVFEGKAAVRLSQNYFDPQSSPLRVWHASTKVPSDCELLDGFPRWLDMEHDVAMCQRGANRFVRLFTANGFHDGLGPDRIMALYDKEEQLLVCAQTRTGYVFCVDVKSLKEDPEFKIEQSDETTANSE